MFRSFNPNAVVTENKCTDCLYWMQMSRIEKRWESSTHLIGLQCITKMFRSFNPNAVVTENKYAECLYWMQMSRIEKTWESSTHLIGLQCITKMFRSFICNTVLLKTQFGQSLWYMIIWKNRRMVCVIELRDWSSMHRQDVASLQSQYCSYTD